MRFEDGRLPEEFHGGRIEFVMRHGVAGQRPRIVRLAGERWEIVYQAETAFTYRPLSVTAGSMVPSEGQAVEAEDMAAISKRLDVGEELCDVVMDVADQITDEARRGVLQPLPPLGVNADGKPRRRTIDAEFLSRFNYLWHVFRTDPTALDVYMGISRSQRSRYMQALKSST